MVKNKLNKKRLFIIFIVFALIVFISICACNLDKILTRDVVYGRPSTSGKLHVSGTKILDEKNRIVQLKGLSTHGVIYSPKIITPPFIENLSKNWNANFFRVAMYSVDYCEKWTDLNLWYLHDAVDWAIENDMYVVIDWHTLTDYDPNKYSDNAIDFFRSVSDKYCNCPNVIYEICNEPNNGTNWNQIYQYAKKVIPVIKENNNDAVIIVGTPNYCQEIADVSYKPLKAFSNILYSFHFYTGTHKEDYRNRLDNAINNLNLPVIVSEFGLTDMTGNGTLYFEEAANWIDFLNKNNIGYAMWSYSDINESSATFKNGIITQENMNDQGLTNAGRWARAMLKNDDIHNFKEN